MSSASGPHSTKACFAVFGALLALTALTVAAAFVDLGGFNNAAALAIAGGKAALVAAFFMGVRGGSRLARATLAAGCLWLAILIGLSMSDFATRNW